MCAALALKQRTRQIDTPTAAQDLLALHQGWGGYSQLAVDSALITSAGGPAQSFGLRASDSLQPASALRVHSQVGAAMAFCCFNTQLITTAGALGVRFQTP